MEIHAARQRGQARRRSRRDRRHRRHEKMRKRANIRKWQRRDAPDWFEDESDVSDDTVNDEDELIIMGEASEEESVTDASLAREDNDEYRAARQLERFHETGRWFSDDEDEDKDEIEDEDEDEDQDEVEDEDSGEDD